MSADAIEVLMKRIDGQKEALDKELADIVAQIDAFEQFLTLPYDHNNGKPAWFDLRAWVVDQLRTRGYVEWQGKCYTEAEWQAVNPTDFYGHLSKLRSSVGFIIHLVLETELPKAYSMAPTKPEGPPQVQINVPTPMAPEAKERKGRTAWDFLSEYFQGRQKPPLTPARLLEETEVVSILEKYKQIVAEWMKLEEWYSATLALRSDELGLAQNPYGFFFDHLELIDYVRRMNLIHLSGAKTAIEHLKEQLSKYVVSLTRSYVQSGAMQPPKQWPSGGSPTGYKFTAEGVVPRE